MAIQLERFLKKQLRDSNLPDREFIEATLTDVLAYQKRMGGVERDGLPTYRGRVHEYFRGLKTRPFIEQDLINKALTDTAHAIYRPTLEMYAGALARDINREGNESAAHLCLPTKYRNALYRANVTRIDTIRDLLASGELIDFRQVGSIGEKEAKTALADFDRLLSESQKA